MQDLMIRHIRESLGLTQQAFADHLNVSQATVSRWEAGNTLPSAAIRRRIQTMVSKHGTLGDFPLIRMVRRSPAIAALLEADMRIITVSQPACTLNRVQPGDVAGLNYRALFTEDVNEAYELAARNGFFNGDLVGVDFFGSVTGFSGDIYYVHATWHLLSRPSHTPPLVLWQAEHVCYEDYITGRQQRPVQLTSIDAWMNSPG